MNPSEVVELGTEHAPEAIELWELAGLTRPWNPPEVDYRRAIRGATSAVLGAYADDHVIGTVMVGHDGHRGWVYYLAVHPSMRRQRIGATLMQAAETWLREQGGVKLQLMVRSDNEDVIAFYRALGYEVQDVTVLGRRLSST